MSIATQPDSMAIPRLGRKELVRRALAAHNRLRPGKTPIRPSADPQKIAQIVVNYLRHELTTYNQDMSCARYDRQKHRAQLEIAEGVYTAIVQAYPELASEARRQLDFRRAGIF